MKTRFNFQSLERAAQVASQLCALFGEAVRLVITFLSGSKCTCGILVGRLELLLFIRLIDLLRLLIEVKVLSLFGG